LFITIVSEMPHLIVPVDDRAKTHQTSGHMFHVRFTAGHLQDYHLHVSNREKREVQNYAARTVNSIMQ
jgi:hypothetical protein